MENVSQLWHRTLWNNGNQQAGAGECCTAGTFILDVQPVDQGLVGNKVYKEGTVPTNANLKRADSDTASVRIVVGLEGDDSNYSPTLSINGVQAVITETTTKRWFQGSAIIELTLGENPVIVRSSTGSSDTAIVNLLPAGPSIIGIDIGPFPGQQTSLKAGDRISLVIHTDPEASFVEIQPTGASASKITASVIAGVATVDVPISGLSGLQHFTAIAKNPFGSAGTAFSSSDVVLDQAKPVISNISVTYPTNQQALRQYQQATVTATVTDFTSIQYISSSDLVIAQPSVYEQVKQVQCSSNLYKVSGTNYSITAFKESNGTQTTLSTLVQLAGIAPTATISIAGSPARLLSSPSGNSYTIRVLPSQIIQTAPSLDASIGTWSGQWVKNGQYWERPLLISDTDAKGQGVFSNLVLLNTAGVFGSEITSGSVYTVGGFTSRTLTFSPFHQDALIGTAVADYSKVGARLTGTSNDLARRLDLSQFFQGFAITKDGSFNLQGNTLFLTDKEFCNTNTTGTLRADVWELA